MRIKNLRHRKQTWVFTRKLFIACQSMEHSLVILQKTFQWVCKISVSISTEHFRITLLTLHKKSSFPLRISSVNLTKSAVFSGNFEQSTSRCFFSFNCSEVEGGRMGYDVINIHNIEPRTHFWRWFMWKVRHVVGDKKGTGHYVADKERQRVGVEVQKIRFLGNYIFFERTLNDVVWGKNKKKRQACY